MFAGVGGFRAGLTRVGGFQCVGHCEIDKYAEASYRAIHDIREEERYYIQAIYPFPDKAAVVCNEEGKNLGLPFNRPLFDENDLPYDIICGTFFVAGLGVEDFVSLTEEQIRRYKEHYDRVMVLTAAKETTPQHKPPHPHKYRRGVER